MTLPLTPGHRHKATVFEDLLIHGTVKRAGGGRPQWRPRRIVGDKRHNGGAIRRYARSHGNAVTIPRRRTERRRGPFDHAAYRARNLVERLINRFKQFRRRATRYEKRAGNHRAMRVPVALLLWF